MVIAVLDDSRIFLKRIELMLNELNFHNINLFEKEEDFFHK